MGRRRLLKAMVPTVLLVFLLTSCAGSGEGTASGTAEPSVVVTDAWVKATDGRMTGVFGIIKNNSDELVLIEGATSSTARAELHETTPKGMMQKVEGGLSIEANSTLALSPGANHIMLMGLTNPITAGQEINITLKLSSGDTIEFVAAAKEYTGADERYEP